MQGNASDIDGFARLRSTFHRLVELDVAQRAAELAAVADESPELAAQLAALLEHVDEADLLPTEKGARALEQVGPFRIVRRIGRGGMGEVYLAERVDGDFAQRVALKLVRRDAVDADLARRFVRERQVLARLDHPHIARLLDGGLAADGRPWLAMQYIDGERIGAWCAARALDVAARVRLMLPVCDAVHYAHRNLVVHRDIKPANVLVDPEGRPHLLDFGIARLLDDGGESTQTFLAMTPAYAAPEQRDGAAGTTAIDVYQLGVLLRELLDPTAHPLPDALRRIVARATAERPEQRYASAAALADDLDDWLSRRPLRSGINSRRERLRLFVARWRWPLAMAVVATLAVGIGTLLVWREAEIATARGRQAEANLRAVLDVLGAANPGRFAGREPVVSDLLLAVAQRLRQDFDDDPHLLQQALGEIGHGLVNLGHARDAVPVLQAALAALRRDPLARATNELGLLKLLVLACDAPGDGVALRQAADRILELAASDPAIRGAALDALASAAAALGGLGDFGSAQRLIVAATLLDPDGRSMNAAQAENHWRQRGRLALRAAQPAQARDAFAQSRAVQSRAPAEFGALRKAELDLFEAEAAIALGDPDAATAALRRVQPVWAAEYPAGHPEQAALALLEARALLLEGDAQAALRAAQRAQAAMQPNASLTRVLRVALAQVGQCAEALALPEPSGDDHSPRSRAEAAWAAAATRDRCP